MDLIIWRHSDFERGVAARNADSRRKAESRRSASRLVARTATAGRNRFDELHPSLLSKPRGRSGRRRSSVDPRSRPPARNLTGAEAGYKVKNGALQRL